ncbi:hypothetical protein SeMB42_g06578 [Synchytrium endobioticum]|uniref:Small ribosomal subunit protein bS18m n=1 Tax=Synchytrium endobioticum TaxID=286115 RepID=A0A507CZM3_9FUNG|nr:hypothetical protein SeMB42_g06578 [Synchytrium endobioticum]TPX44614.1 hypothetical protein SeLEV6574_g04388 [Synchytrium endobioticum]
MTLPRLPTLSRLLPPWSHRLSNPAKAASSRFMFSKSSGSFPVPPKPRFHLYGRLFAPGELYEPQDLNATHTEEQKQRLERAAVPDYFAVTGKNPLNCYKDVLLLSNFVTQMGHIAPRSRTGLSIQNQRRVAKAIRRARAMGLMAYTHK